MSPHFARPDPRARARPLVRVRRLASAASVAAVVLAACTLVAPRPRLRYSLAEPPRVRLERGAPDVTWQWDRALGVNMDGDAAPELVVLGTTAKETVVGVIIGAEAEPWISRWAQGNGSMDTCAPPAAMSIRKYACRETGAPPFCAPRKDPPPVDPALEAFRLDGGACDSFHFYFDGTGFTWWRA